MKLGVFDSGIGGVTVLQALRKRFPGERFAYFGDTLHVPYGTKSATQIRTLSQSAAERIQSYGVDALVVACNTASSLALEDIATVLAPVPVYGMVDAGVRSVLRKSASVEGPIVVFGTRATIRSGVYGRHFRQAFPQSARLVFEQACPLLVPLIEEGWIRHPVLEATLREYVKAFVSYESGIALLACTHYPWIRKAFRDALPGWTIVDSADAVAERLAKESGKLGLDAETTAGIASVEWYFSDPEIAPFVFEGQETPPEIRTF